MLELSKIDSIWLLFCSCLLLIMQAGFLCLESGLIRPKNAINVVMKNLADLCISFLFFGLIGFGLMFNSPHGVVGEFMPVFSQYESSVYIFFIFQAMFCATTATIVSGAAAERMSFAGYMVITIVVASFIYPLIGGWIWGASLYPNASNGWLANLGFYDFAGATVVHSVGGWVALAVIIFIGPRLGRYSDASQRFEGSSITLACLGALLIWVGWLGFNGGSLLSFNDAVPKVVLNTIIGGVGGMTSGLVASYILHRKALAIFMINGCLIGLISVTGAANLMYPTQALMLGLIAGLLPQGVNKLLNYFEIDDAIGAVPVHLAGGIFGTIVVALFIELTPDQSRVDALLIQLLGITAVGFTAFFLAFATLFLVNKFIKMRVSEQDEQLGLNTAEHNVLVAHQDLMNQMSENLASGDLNKTIEVNPFSDSYPIASFYNQVVDKFESIQHEKQNALNKAVYESRHDAMTGLLNRMAITNILKQEQDKLLNSGYVNYIALVDIDYFKNINDSHGHDIGDKAIKHIAMILKTHLRSIDIVSRYGGEEFCILIPNVDLHYARNSMESLRKSVENMPLKVGKLHIKMTVCIGLACMAASDRYKDVIKLADIALYQGKSQGRNMMVVYDASLK